MRLMKGKNAGPLQAEVLQLVESCINTAMLSVLSKKKVPSFESIQGHLSVLKKRLLQLCKDMRVPATKLGKLKNLERDIQEEKRKMAEYEETLELLNQDIEEAVEAAKEMEESTASLEEKMETLREQAADMSSSLEETLSNTDPLQLPPTTFQAPTMQDRVRKLQNPELILKELTQVQGNPVYKNLQTLLPMCYTEISTL
ncbi:centromere protein Q isoform X2 [Hyla sarda]|nr:centromere protein Q isoform X2 [Hyla sarda]